jgi:hypothetical protein
MSGQAVPYPKKLARVTQELFLPHCGLRPPCSVQSAPLSLFAVRRHAWDRLPQGKAASGSRGASDRWQPPQRAIKTSRLAVVMGPSSLGMPEY